MLGMTSWQKGELATARVHFEESLKISTETGNKNRMAWSLWFLSNVDMLQGDYPQGYSHAEAGLLLFRERGNSRLIAYSLVQIAWGYLEEGDAVKAYPLFEESSALFKEIGDKALARLALWGLGWVAFQQGNIALARSLLEEASTTFQGEESPDNLENQAWAARLGGQPKRCVMAWGRPSLLPTVLTMNAQLLPPVPNWESKYLPLPGPKEAP
jgi:tetratricopeptide (TPR) repeat protein